MTPDEPPPLREAIPGAEGRPERWRPIPGHRGYEASSLGRVRSVARTLRDGRAAGGMVRKPQRDKDGYLTMLLGRKRVRVNIAVALAFHGGPEVRHLDGDRSNNRPENLAWGSRVENEQDKKRHKEEKLGQWREPPVLFETPLGHNPITLSEAVSLSVVSCSLDAIRKASQRDPLFPEVRDVAGLARVYDPAELAAWDKMRRPS